MYGVAFHGDFASGSRLKRDMGSPSFVHFYPDWKRIQRRQGVVWLCDEIRRLADDSRVVLLGYSSGGAVINELLHDDELISRVAGIVQYESPMFLTPPIEEMGRRGVKVFNIWNDYDPRLDERYRQKQAIIRFWENVDIPVVFETGKYTSHVRVNLWRRSNGKPVGIPFDHSASLMSGGDIPYIFSHAWDADLNAKIREWIDGL